MSFKIGNKVEMKMSTHIVILLGLQDIMNFKDGYYWKPGEVIEHRNPTRPNDVFVDFGNGDRRFFKKDGKDDVGRLELRLQK